MLAKLRHAATNPAPILDLARAAMLDAVEWMAGDARTRGRGTDAALFDAMEEDKAARVRFGRALARMRRREYRPGEPGCALSRLAAAWHDASDRVAATRPATLEGLLAKLRHAERGMHRCPTFELQHAARMDAIAWLEPPKPKRRRSGARREGAAP